MFTDTPANEGDLEKAHARRRELTIPAVVADGFPVLPYGAHFTPWVRSDGARGVVVINERGEIVYGPTYIRLDECDDVLAEGARILAQAAQLGQRPPPRLTVESGESGTVELYREPCMTKGKGYLKR